MSGEMIICSRYTYSQERLYDIRADSGTLCDAIRFTDEAHSRALFEENKPRIEAWIEEIVEELKRALAFVRANPNANRRIALTAIENYCVVFGNFAKIKIVYEVIDADAFDTLCDCFEAHPRRVIASAISDLLTDERMRDMFAERLKRPRVARDDATFDISASAVTMKFRAFVRRFSDTRFRRLSAMT
jgi:hypothetical protein